MIYRRFALARRPEGMVTLEDFELIEGPLPEPERGEVLVEHSHLGLAPGNRIRMSADTRGYRASIPLGGTVTSAAVGTVVASRNPKFAEGDAVTSFDGGWQTHAISNGSNLRRVDLSLAPAPTWLGALGMSGFAAYVGTLDFARPKAGETFVVSAAAGAVGSVAAQVAATLGCTTVGIAGGTAKCTYVEENFGVGRCVDYRAVDFIEQLAASCPSGIDVYFDNVGGHVRDVVWPLLNEYGRVAVCGQISQYNEVETNDATAASATGPSWFPLLTKSLTVRGFLAGNSLAQRYDDFRQDMSRWIRNGDVVSRDHVTEGFESTPQAFIDMLVGRNFGKTIVAI
jgi:NADPH-dependent curcumin reductase CurA